MVLMDGEVIDIGGDYLDAPGYDLLGLIVGSEGQFGIVTEATVRILRAPEGARPMLLGFDSSEAAGACVAAIIAAGIMPVAIEFMDKPAIEVCETFAEAGYPLDVEALLIVEVEGSRRRDRRPARHHRRDRRALSPPRGARQQERRAERGDLEGPQGGLRRHRPDLRLLLHGRRHPAVASWPRCSTEVGEICRRHGFSVANIFHAGDGNLHPLILYNANDAAELERAEMAGAEILKLCVELGGCLTGEHGVGIEKRDLMRVQFTAADLALQMRIKSVFDPDWLLNPAKVFPLEGRERQ